MHLHSKPAEAMIPLKRQTTILNFLDHMEFYR